MSKDWFDQRDIQRRLSQRLILQPQHKTTNEILSIVDSNSIDLETLGLIIMCII